jgi:hypothetical protein
MPTLPNPFIDSAVAHPATADAAAASSSPAFTGDAAAEPFLDENRRIVGGYNEKPESSDGPDIPLAELTARGFRGEAFLKSIAPDIEPDPLPMFLSAPSREYLSATDILPVLMTLAGR